MRGRLDEIADVVTFMANERASLLSGAKNIGNWFRYQGAQI